MGMQQTSQDMGSGANKKSGAPANNEGYHTSSCPSAFLVDDGGVPAVREAKVLPGQQALSFEQLWKLVIAACH